MRAFHSASIRSGLVSCRWRPWGCALQSLDRPEDPYPSLGRVPSCRSLLQSAASQLETRSIQASTPCERRQRSEGRRRHAFPFGLAWGAENHDLHGATVPVLRRHAETRRGPRFQRNGPFVVPSMGCRTEWGKPPSGCYSLRDAVPAGRGLADRWAAALMGFRLFTGFPSGVVGLPSQTSPPRALRG